MRPWIKIVVSVLGFVSGWVAVDASARRGPPYPPTRIVSRVDSQQAATMIFTPGRNDDPATLKKLYGERVASTLSNNPVHGRLLYDESDGLHPSFTTASPLGSSMVMNDEILFRVVGNEARLHKDGLYVGNDRVVTDHKVNVFAAWMLLVAFLTSFAGYMLSAIVRDAWLRRRQSKYEKAQAEREQTPPGGPHRTFENVLVEDVLRQAAVDVDQMNKVPKL